MSNGRNHALISILMGFGAVWFSGCASVPSAAPAAPPTSAQAGATTIVAVAPPAAPSMTLPRFLGLDLVFAGTAKGVSCVRNRLATRFPALEPKPPVKSLTDPANLSPEASPAVQAAAKAKAEDDKAPQKAKAIKYLASRGCGECFPETEDALIAALDDCNEAIRYGVVRGLQGSVGSCCQSCRTDNCCTPKLLNKLYNIAYERDDQGCFLESSARVRRNARLVICKCGGVPQDLQQLVPLEGPPAEVLLGGGGEESSAAVEPTKVAEASPADPNENAVMVASESESLLPMEGAASIPALPVSSEVEGDSIQVPATAATFRLPDLSQPESTSAPARDE